MVIYALRISCGAFNPSHGPTGITGSMRLLGYDLDLIEFKLDGGLAAEHGNNHVHRIVFDLDTLDGTVTFCAIISTS